MSIFSKWGTSQCASVEYRQNPPTRWSYMPPAAMASRVRRPMWQRVVGTGAATASPAEAQLDERRTGKLRRGAEATPFGVETGLESRDDARHDGVGVETDRGCDSEHRPARTSPPPPLVVVAAAAAPMVSARLSSLRTAPTSASACARTCPRSLVHASPSACTTRRNEGMPWRSTGGKYVPAKKGVHPVCRRSTSATRPTRSTPGRRSCRARPDQDAPRGRP